MWSRLPTHNHPHLHVGWTVPQSTTSTHRQHPIHITSSFPPSVSFLPSSPPFLPSLLFLPASPPPSSDYRSVYQSFERLTRQATREVTLTHQAKKKPTQILAGELPAHAASACVWIRCRRVTCRCVKHQPGTNTIVKTLLLLCAGANTHTYVVPPASAKSRGRWYATRWRGWDYNSVTTHARCVTVQRRCYSAPPPPRSGTRTSSYADKRGETGRRLWNQWGLSC